MILEACLIVTLTIPLLNGVLPDSIVGRSKQRRMSLVRGWAGLNAGAAGTALFASFLTGPMVFSLNLLPEQSPIRISFLLDSVSTLMWLLVAGVGWVICRFSQRYLDGDPNQGRYFNWMGFTLGAVSLTVLSANLFLMTFGFLLTSLGLHQLLLHFSDRDEARFPANLKFFFSRMGDLCLLGSAVILYRTLGTADLPQIFETLKNVNASAEALQSELTIAAFLLAGCAVFKSAQFPFHTWLPETMEAPTPVSALMHAGIVNGGGYLLIRTAPILVLAPNALWAVAGLGAFTAIFAAVAMQSQSSVKRSLAWSTIAQMGFMMLQCGLGAFSAAMLHIVAHSLYKAHAFLNSGNVLNDKKATAGGEREPHVIPESISIVVAGSVVACVAFGMCSLFAVTPASKPGGWILGFVLVLGLIRWSSMLVQRGWGYALPAAGFSAGLFAAYLASFTLVDSAMHFGASIVAPIPLSAGLLSIISVAVVALFFMETAVRHMNRSRWYRSLYVHSNNGFYIDAIWRRLAIGAKP